MKIGMLAALLLLTAHPLHAQAPATPVYGYKVVHRFPHSTSSYTEGFFFSNGLFYEGTGMLGRSALLAEDPATGKVVQRNDLDQYSGDLLPVAVGDEPAYACAVALLQQSSGVIDWTDCPLVEVIPGKVSGVPLIKNTRMPADGVLSNYETGSPVEEISENFDLPERTIRDLLSYAAKQNPALKL